MRPEDLSVLQPASGPDVFVSYKSEDRPRILDIERHLERAGVSIWRDQKDIPGGDDWKAAVVAGIKSCKVLVVICTQAALESANVQQELSVNWDYCKPRKPIVPLLLEPINVPDALQYCLAGRQFIQVHDRPEAVWVPELLRALASKGIRCRTDVAAADMETARRGRGEAAKGEPIPESLPGLLGTFVDREDKRQELGRLLHEGQSSVAVVVAPAGFGKTELVVKVLREELDGDRIRDPNLKGILYLDCEQGDVKLAQIFGYGGRIVGQVEQFRKTSRGRGPLKQKLAFFFQTLSRAGAVWIFLDNFEGLLAHDDSIADPDIRQLVETAVGRTEHRVRLIIASRAVPRFEGSYRLRVIDISSGLPEDEAVRYLRVNGGDSVLARADEPLLRALVRRLDGIPKALESLIGYLSEEARHVPLDELFVRDAFIADFDRYNTERGLKGLLQKQFDRLSREARLALCTLAVFPRPVHPDGLHALLPGGVAWTTVMSRLERNKLIRWQDGRYDMVPLVREFAYDHIPEETDVSPGPERSRVVAFVRWNLHEAAADFYHQKRKPQDEWKDVEDLEAHIQELYHRLKAGQYDLAEEILFEIEYEHLMPWGYSVWVSDWRKELTGRLSGPGLEGRNRRCLGLAYRETGDLQKAIGCFEDSLKISRDIGDRAMQGAALANLGIACNELGDLPRALECHQHALPLVQEIGDRRWEGSEVGNLGDVYLSQGKVAEAIEHYEQALAIHRAIPYRQGEALWLTNLGTAYQLSGELDRAVDCCTQARTLAMAEGHLHTRAMACLGLGAIAHCRGHLASARQFYMEALDQEVRRTSYTSAIKLGILCLQEGKQEEARENLDWAADLCQDMLLRTPRLYDARYQLALAQLALGQGEEALDTYRRARADCSGEGVVGIAIQDVRLLKQSIPAAVVDPALALLVAPVVAPR
jgi:tetratricopeptide (TPR) repeat protein